MSIWVFNSAALSVSPQWLWASLWIWVSLLGVSFFFFVVLSSHLHEHLETVCHFLKQRINWVFKVRAGIITEAPWTWTLWQMGIVAEGPFWFTIQAFPGLETDPDAVTSLYVYLDLSLFDVSRAE